MMQNKMLPFVVIVATTCVASLPVGATVFTVDLIATSTTTVQPGESVSYDIVGELSGDPSLGLALSEPATLTLLALGGFLATRRR
jgi:hypothetical protein